ncbi:MAG: glutamine synthetase family protein [Candidatus Aminicenantia bacterium]
MKNFGFKDEKEVLDFLKEEKEVKFVRLLFPDVLGRVMSFSIPSEELKSAFEEGVGFDGSSVEGFARIYESDLNIIPEPETFRVLPWRYELSGVIWKEAIVFGDIYDSKSEHFPGDSRFLLKKTLEKYRDFGEFFVGPELEFYVFENDAFPKLLDRGGYFRGGRWGELRKLSMIFLKDMGIEIECDHHEVGASQHEIDLKFSNAIKTADLLMIAKYVLKRTAERIGIYVSFMPKPVTTLPGNGLHLHLSLWKNGKNLFFENKGLSEYAKKFLMGLIHYGKEIQILLNQWVNSYKRLVPGYEAPVYMAWGIKNRSAYIRVPEYREGKENSTRIELRSPDPSCNIYLALSAIFSAGVRGIKENLELIPPQERDIYHMDEREMEEAKIKVLSSNLKEALELFKKSELAREVLGEHIFTKIIQNKEMEWEKYEKAVGKKYEKEVSPYEIEEYFPVL